MENIKIRKWWWAWNYEKIEAWLEEMALKGYMVSRVTGSGEIFYFYKTDPKKTRFCVDYQPELKSDYIQLLSEDGWSYIKIPGNWILCWKEYDDARPELFNDYDSIIERNNKLMAVMAGLFVPLVLLPNLALNRFKLGVFNIPITIIYCLIFMFYIFAVSSLSSTNTALKKKKNLQGK
jgi:hypothetical protein